MIPKPPNCRFEVAIVGLGYVGLPLALGFAEAGCRTLGFDLDTRLIWTLQDGSSPFSHLPAERITAAGDRICFTSDKNLLAETEAIIICVPTPLRAHLDPDLRHILRAGEEIGPLLRYGSLVSLESSTYPGTTREDLCRVLEEKSGLLAGVDFALAFSPEREDPGNGQSVLRDMPKVVGAVNPASLVRAIELYGRAIKTVVPVSDCDTAEAVKLTENIFRFINIALVNDLKRVYAPMGIDIWEVIKAATTKPFGFMPFYPGPGVGGHCIPIDPFYLTWKAREFGLETPLIELAGQINRAMPNYVTTRLFTALNARARPVQGCRVLVLGVAYKPDVADDRESPSYVVMDLLHEHGALVDYYDPMVPVIHCQGANPRWINCRSITWSPENLERYEAAVICTGHRGVDYDELASTVPLIVDACHIVPEGSPATVVPA